MADLIRIKGGSGAAPELQDRELGYHKGEQTLYIGTEDGNVRLCGSGDIPRLEQLIENITARLEALEKPSE